MRNDEFVKENFNTIEEYCTRTLGAMLREKGSNLFETPEEAMKYMADLLKYWAQFKENCIQKAIYNEHKKDEFEVFVRSRLEMIDQQLDRIERSLMVLRTSMKEPE